MLPRLLLILPCWVACSPILELGDDNPRDADIHEAAAEAGSGGTGGAAEAGPTDADCSECSPSGTIEELVAAGDGKSRALCLALDETSLYFAGSDPAGTFKLWKMLKEGGPVEELAQLPFEPTDLALDDARAYVALGKQIVTIGKQGGTPATLAASSGRVRRLAVDAGEIFWSVEGVQGAPSRIDRLTTSGGAPEPIVTGLFDAWGVFAAGPKLYWTDRGVALSAAGFVGWADRSGTSTEVLASFVEPVDVVASSSFVFAADLEGSLRKIPLSGGSSQAIAPIGSPRRLAFDGTFVYAASRSWQKIWRVAAASDSALPQLLADAPAVVDPYDIDVDQKAVYWVEGADGRVMRRIL
jgi:hypothetical protein